MFKICLQQAEARDSSYAISLTMLRGTCKELQRDPEVRKNAVVEEAYAHPDWRLADEDADILQNQLRIIAPRSIPISYSQNIPKFENYYTKSC